MRKIVRSDRGGFYVVDTFWDGWVSGPHDTVEEALGDAPGATIDTAEEVEIHD